MSHVGSSQAKCNHLIISLDLQKKSVYSLLLKHLNLASGQSLIVCFGKKAQQQATIPKSLFLLMERQSEAWVTSRAATRLSCSSAAFSPGRQKFHRTCRGRKFARSEQTKVFPGGAPSTRRKKEAMIGSGWKFLHRLALALTPPSSLASPRPSTCSPPRPPPSSSSPIYPRNEFLPGTDCFKLHLDLCLQLPPQSLQSNCAQPN